MEEFNFKNNISKLYFCIDIETTGLDPLKGDIIEVYWKIMSYENNIENKISENYNLFWSPKWYKTKKIHQIKLKELIGKSKFTSNKSRQFRNELISLINRCKDPNDPLTFMAQYAPFELSWFKEKLKIDINGVKVYDTRLMEKELYPELPHGLIKICERRNISFPNGQHDFHRADQDVNAMWEVAKQQFKEI